MIIGIGYDIVDHAVTEKLNWSTDTELLKEIFSEKELTLYSKNKVTRFIAGRFAGKEAVLKSLSTGMEDGLDLTSINILQMASGKPYILLQGEVKKLSDSLQINSWHISISHTKYYSCAFVIAEYLT